MPLGRSSIPHVAFIKFDLIGFEERAEFLLKGLDAVVLALVANVGPHFFDLRLAHRERPESSLPEEPLVEVIYPKPNTEGDRLIANDPIEIDVSFDVKKIRPR